MITTTWLLSSLITSQNATAPKPDLPVPTSEARLITSQNATAPKHLFAIDLLAISLITSQNATAPKLQLHHVYRIPE